VRDELANEMAQKLGIRSAVLRQELKHAATNRATKTITASAEAQVTQAERILIRALASVTDIAPGEGSTSARDGADDEFDPARQARFALRHEHLHQGLTTESLLEQLVANESVDVMSLPLSESDRRLVAEVLLHDQEELSPELVENAVRSLRKRVARCMLEQMQAELPQAAARLDPHEQARLAQERVRLKLSTRPR
jgi:DNA primase